MWADDEREGGGDRAARSEARPRHNHRADKEYRHGGSRREEGADRRGSPRGPPRDWIPDRFNRNEQGGRQNEEAGASRRDWGDGGRGHEERGGRGRGRGRDWQDTSGTDELPALFSIHPASVQSVRPFGLFVKLEGYRKNGLVHVSQVSEHEVTRREDAEDAKVEALRGVATEGDRVWVKVISLKEGEGGGGAKVGCSLKLVSQADGRDLDANNLILDKHEKKPAWQQPKKLELGAVLDVTCTRCGGRGHLKTDCYAALDTQYDLLPDEDETLLPTEGSRPGVNEESRRGQGSGANDVPLGRGRGMTQPAWMTQGRPQGAPVIGQPANRDEGGMVALPPHIGSVEEALAVIEKLKAEKKARKAQRKERRKEQRKKEEKRKKKKKKDSEEGDTTEDSESESESEDERRRRKKRRKERRERRKCRRGETKLSGDSSTDESVERGGRRGG